MMNRNRIVSANETSY